MVPARVRAGDGGGRWKWGIKKGQLQGSPGTLINMLGQSFHQGLSHFYQNIWGLQSLWFLVHILLSSLRPPAAFSLYWYPKVSEKTLLAHSHFVLLIQGYCYPVRIAKSKPEFYGGGGNTQGIFKWQFCKSTADYSSSSLPTNSHVQFNQHEVFWDAVKRRAFSLDGVIPAPLN